MQSYRKAIDIISCAVVLFTPSEDTRDLALCESRAHRAGMNTLGPGCPSAVDGLEPELARPILSSLRMAKQR